MPTISPSNFESAHPIGLHDISQRDRPHIENDAKEALFRSFFSLIEEKAIPYAILSNYFAYPETIHSDVDIVVPEAYRASLPALVQATCQKNDAYLLQISEYHNTTACSCFVGALQDNTPVHIRFDICSDDHRYSKLILPWQFLLEGRRRYEDSFFVPAPEKSLLHYLLKRIEKRSVEQPQLLTLSRWYATSTVEADRLLQAYWPLEHEQIINCIQQQIVPERRWLDAWSRNVHLRDARQSPLARARQYGRELGRDARRVKMPMGYLISFLGPDGCGKTTAIEASKRELAPAFAHTAEFHLLPRLLLRGRKDGDALKPHAKVPRRWLASVAKILVWFADLVAGYWLVLWPALIHSTLVIFDRYIHDLQVDRTRYRYGGPQWLAALMCRLSPQPDLWVLLDAAPEVLFRRKPELALEEIGRQRGEYRVLLAKKGNAVTIDASQTPDQVVADICREVFRRLAARTVERYHIRYHLTSADPPQ